ncbi:MAG: PIN domain-containing protein [Cyanobacteria bacterium J06633_8]
MSNFSALLDACVIFPFSLSNILLEAAHKGLYRVHFSHKILDEAITNRVKRGKMEQPAADRFRSALIEGFSHALVESPVDLEDKMDNHPGDRHVLASAVYAKVDVIVTSNVKHFPPSSVSHWGIEVMHPDDFLSYLCDENGDDILCDLLSGMIANYKKPPITDLEFISNLEKQQPKFASRMLISKYGDCIQNFARNVLMTVPVPSQDMERCLNGKIFKICEINNSIVINERSSKRKVFCSYNDEFTGEMKVKDIELFNQVSKEIEVNKIPSKVRKLRNYKSKIVES